MKEGIIVRDEGSWRADIKFRDGTRHGGLHCGASLEAFLQGKWVPMRIEYRHSSDTWYLIGVDDDEIVEILWLTVRK